MTVLSAARDTKQMGNDAVPMELEVSLGASAKLFQGALVCLSAGYAVAAASTAGLICAGRSRRLYDNTGGAAGALKGQVERGIFKYANGDAIAQADVGKPAYVSDDQTVIKGGNGLGCIAGPIIGVDADGVWVAVGVGLGLSTAVLGNDTIVAIPVPALAAIADAGVLARFTPGFAGRIKKVAFQTTTAATTGSKLTTLTTKIATVAMTGGVLALTSANQTPIGANVAGSAITALNTFGATDEVTVVASATTAFVEGAGVILITLGQ